MEVDKRLIWAERLCSRRECCIHDLRIKFKEMGATPQEAEQMIAALIQNNYLNEERYVRAFVHDKSKLQGWGVQKICYALRAKQIPDLLIGKGVSEIDKNAQKETLRRLLEKKRRSVKGRSQAEVEAKLIRFGLARGFGYEEVVSAASTVAATYPGSA